MEWRGEGDSSEKEGHLDGEGRDDQGPIGIRKEETEDNGILLNDCQNLSSNLVTQKN